ncbi:hypothetical protein EV356DRAFT_536195 [Viridothelium virens]|uniref:RRM domain-containing protein n=1 Tax=Viridothelium virens TaxID=1048519 RepID=A0A6A6GZG8_VIRVR|nr:hypothetical protein EV356DRAFT_536195 [Viridothelium virens]
MRGRHSLFISGIPKGYNWKKLKDLARDSGADPQWTDLEPSQYERDKLMGYTSFKDGVAAQRLYDHLTSTKLTSANLRVHYWDTPQSPDLGTATLLKCNCQDLGSECVVNSPPRFIADTHPARRSSLPLSGTAYSSRVSNTVTPSDPHFAPQLVPVASHVPTPYLTPDYYRQNPAIFHAGLSSGDDTRQFRGSVPPTHLQARDGTPINVSRGAYRTEARSIFISNLPYNLERSELENLLRRFSRHVKCNVGSQRRPGTATAEFATREEACSARDSLNGTQLKGRQLTVRFARETTVSGTVDEGEPIIVNGSGRN